MEKLGRYEILETLGTGSMGVVYKARDTLLYREIALKTIGTGPTVDPELRERFFREARACALLQHPNIVTVFDLGEADNMAYIVMELLQGDDLRRLIEDKRPLPLDVRVDLMVQVCEALGHAHQHQVIHRDIKPSNIFVQPNNRPKVLDFGIARLPSSKLTLVGRVLGTPNYMAPEQILGQGCDRRSDLFSAAVVFFEFATGVHPFRSSFIPSRIVDGKPDRLRDANPDLPYALETSLARALEKDADRRYQSGEQFAADLKNVLLEIRSAQPAERALVYDSPKTQIFKAPLPEPARPSEADPGADTDFGTAPPGQESSEWRVSEFLRLLHEFDNSAAQGDLKGARKAFVHMKKLETKDPRFGTAAAEYGNRLVELEDRLEPSRSPEPRAEPVPKPPPPSCPPSRNPAETRPIARPEESPMDQTLPVTLPPRQNITAQPTAIFENPAHTEDRRPAPPSQPKMLVRPGIATPPPPPPPPRWDPPRTPPPTPPPSQPPQLMQPPRTETGKTKLKPEQIVIRVAAAFGVLLLIAGAAYWYFFAGAELLRAVGTAEVISPKAAIYEGPSAGKVLYPLVQGDKVNVVRLPRSIRPHWVRVQHVSGGKVSPAGFARAAALGNWSTFALLNVFRPDESADRNELAAYVKSLEHLAMQSPPPAGKNQIWLETAIQCVALARATRQAGERPDEWLGHAARALDAIGEDPELRTQTDELRKALKSFR